MVQGEDGLLLVLIGARPIDQAVDRAGTFAALGTQDVRRLTREGGEGDIAVDIFRDMTRQRRLARAGIAEQPEDGTIPSPQPFGYGGERIFLLGRPAHEGSDTMIAPDNRFMRDVQERRGRKPASFKQQSPASQGRAQKHA